MKPGATAKFLLSLVSIQAIVKDVPGELLGPNSNWPTMSFVATVHALRLLHGLPGQTVQLTGYRTTSDGGEGTFVWADGAPDDDNCTTFRSPGGVWRRRIGNMHWDWKWCGAYGDRSHDDTDAIQALYAAANRVSQTDSRFGIVVEPSPGEYLISHVIKITGSHVHTVSGGGNVTVNSLSSTEDIFSVGGLNEPIYDIAFDGITFIKSGDADSSGYAVNFEHGSGFSVERSYIYGANKLYGGIRLSEVFQSRIENTTIEKTLGESAVFGGHDAGAGATSDVFVNNIRSIGCRSAIKSKPAAETGGCFRIDDFTSGLFFDNVEVFGNPAGYAFYFNTHLDHLEAGGQNGTATFSNINSDGSGNLCHGGFYIQNYSLVTIGGGSWITANNCDAISIQPTADHIFVATGTTIGANQRDGSKPRGMYIDGANVTITGANIKGYTQGLQDGVFIGSSAQDVFLGGGTVIEDFAAGIHAATLRNKRYSLDGVRFVRIRTGDDDLVGFVNNRSNSSDPNIDSFAGSLAHILSSDAMTRTFAASTEMDLPAGPNVYIIKGTTPIRRLNVRYVGQVIRLVFRDKRASLARIRSATDNIDVANDLITTRDNQMITLIADGTTWHQTQ